MDPVQRLGEGRKAAAAEHVGLDPFRQLRQLQEGLRDRAAQRSQREAFRQGIHWLDQRQFGEAGLIDHPVRVHDLQRAVEHLCGAGDITRLAERQQLLDVTRLGAKECQHHVAGVVAGIDQIGRARAAGRRGAVAVDGHLQRHHGSDHDIPDLGPGPAVDHAGGQVQQQVDQPRRLVAVEQVAQQLVLLRTHARKTGGRRKQRVETFRTHRQATRR